MTFTTSRIVWTPVAFLIGVGLGILLTWRKRWVDRCLEELNHPRWDVFRFAPLRVEDDLMPRPEKLTDSYLREVEREAFRGHAHPTDMLEICDELNKVRGRLYRAETTLKKAGLMTPDGRYVQCSSSLPAPETDQSGNSGEPTV